jgi:hypothetical protein
MFSPGGTLRAAREKLKLTQADIAEATRIKLHMVDAIENNDFSRIAAPLYGKGFIKLYAERVGLDPAPLIRDYLIRHAREVRPTLHTDGTTPAGGTGAAGVAAMSGRRSRCVMPASAGDLVATGRAMVMRMARDGGAAIRQAAEAIVSAWASRNETGRGVMRDPRLAREYGRATEFPAGRYAAVGMAVLVVAILMGFLIHWMARASGSSRPVVAPAEIPAVSKPAPAASAARLRLAEEPPAPYIKLRKP